MPVPRPGRLVDVAASPAGSGGFDGGTRQVRDQNLVPASLPDRLSLSGLSETDMMTNGAPKVPKRSVVRSSVACAHCRQAKVKCENDGGQRPCHTCIRTGRKCEYANSNLVLSRRTSNSRPLLISSAAAAGSGSLKRDDLDRASERASDHGPDRKRQKRVYDARRLDPQSSGAFYADEVLFASYLTETMWTEIFEIYRLHFATELPFLHVPTLKERMGDKFQTNVSRRSHETNLVLLGVLTLTARFHTNLVQYVTHKLNHGSSKVRSGGLLKPDPWAASEFYSCELDKALGTSRTSMNPISVERVQVYLMMGLYEWSQAKERGGYAAWMHVGTAIRMAQALGLCFDDKHSRTPSSPELPTPPGNSRLSPRSSIADTSPTASGADAGVGAIQEPPSSDTSGASPPRTTTLSPESASDVFVMKEVRRRTMFSCFILDRILCCGFDRMFAVSSENLQIQLPCSEVNFGLAEEVQTGFLQTRISSSPAGSIQNAMATHDSVMARFIQLVHIWGEISKYSFRGGRLNETRPPWEETEFRRLDRALDKFYAGLPPSLKLSRVVYHGHEQYNESSTYVSLHMLGSVCRIMLHREFVPFIPIRCSSPSGPLDEPTFPEDAAPPGFWAESAEHLFKAAKDIVDLIELCQPRNKLPMSALVVFAVWTAAFVGIYAWHFPQLDVKRHMLGEYDGGYSIGCAYGHGNDAGEAIDSYGPTGTTFATLSAMSSWLQMAGTYVKYFGEMDKFYHNVKDDYFKHVAQNGGETDKYGVRMGGAGGGLEEWKLHGRKVTNNGTIRPEDALVETADQSPVSSLFSVPDGSSVAGSESGTVTYAISTKNHNNHAIATTTSCDPATEVPRSVPANTFPPFSNRTWVKPDEATVTTAAPEKPVVSIVGADGEVNVPIDGLLPQCLPQQTSFLQPSPQVTEQLWEDYSPPPQHPVSMPQLLQGLSSSSPHTHLHEPPSFGGAGLVYDVDVQRYVNRHEGMRWQEADPACGSEHLAHLDWKSRCRDEPCSMYPYAPNGRTYESGHCTPPGGWC